MAPSDDPLMYHSVLAVSPHEAARSFVRAALRPAHVLVVERGDEALRCMNNAIFDAYDLDYWVPDWSGVGLCKTIRKADPNVPICFFAKTASADTKKRALRAGADAFVYQPVEKATLKSAVEKLILARVESRRRALQQAQLNEQIKPLLASSAPVTELMLRRARKAIEGTLLSAGATRADCERLWQCIVGEPHQLRGALVEKHGRLGR